MLLAVQGLARGRAALVALLAAVRELVRSAGALLGVDRLALAPVESAQGARTEVQGLAQRRALPADLPPGLQGGRPQVRHRLVSRPQLLQPPQHRPIPGGRLCQATTRPETGARAVHGEGQQISRVLGRAACGRGCGPLPAQRREGAVVTKGIEATDGMLFRTRVVAPLWAQARFVAVGAVEKAHAGTNLQESTAVSRCGEQG